MLSIKLKNKQKVKVDNFSFGYTYAGVLAGSSNTELNLRIFENLKFPSNWGERKCLKISPELNDFSKPLKPVYYSAFLYSSKPIEVNNFGSHLVVIWLDDEPNNRTIEQIIESGVKNIDWVENAEDFNY